MLVIAAIAGGLLHALRGFAPVLGLLPMQIHVGAALAAAGLLAAHVLPYRHRPPDRPRAAHGPARGAGGRGRAGAVGRRAGPGRRYTGSHAGGRAARHAVAVRPGARPRPDGLAAAAPRRPARPRRARRPPADDRPRGDRLHRRLVGRGGVAGGAARRPGAAVDRAGRRVGHRLPPPPPRARRRAPGDARGGRPLPDGHGGPARLVVPGRRGFWWVKWVVAVDRPTSRGGGSRRYPCSDRHITCMPT